MTAITILLIIFIWTILSGLAFYYKADSVGMTDYANDFFEAYRMFFNKETPRELKEGLCEVWEHLVRALTIVVLWLSVPVVIIGAYLYAPLRFVWSHFMTQSKSFFK